MPYLGLERYFEFQRLNTSWKTEILAGITTFVTMAYIVFVNPSILKDAGMPVPAVFAATCLSAAFATILMGVFARYPIALAPGMGLNAYFTYTVVKGMGVPWETALGAVFLSGIAFLILTLAGIRQWIIAAIPPALYAAVSAGIGLFIAFIGLRNAGIIVANQATTVGMGQLATPGPALALFGLVLIAALQAWGVPASMLVGIVVTALIAVVTGVAEWRPTAYDLSAIGETAFELDVVAALSRGILEIILVFFFVDLFDNVGTLVAVSKKAGLVDENHRIPRIDRILLSDSAGTIAGSMLGTSTVVSYIESAAGVAAGGRSGVTAIVTGLLFATSIFIAPLIGVVPAAATAPALIVVGSLMMSAVREIDWDDAVIAVPAFLTLIAIPLTFSIANGLAFGFTVYVILAAIRRGPRSISWPMYLMTALFILRFIYMAG